jgi:hypothetical protein
MANLEYTILGVRFNLVIVTLSIILGWLICFNTVYSSSNINLQDGLSLINNSDGIKLGINLSGDISLGL